MCDGMGALVSQERHSHSHPDDDWEKFSEFLCGFGAGFTNICVTYPLNKIIFRQMLHGVSMPQAVSQLQKEGPYLLYRGILPPLCQKASSMSIMFGSYNYYTNLFIRTFPNSNHQLIKSCSAGLAGFSEAILTPFERVQTLLQDRHYNSKFSNTMHAVRVIWTTHGVREFYRGYSMIAFRNSASNVLFFAAREKVQVYFPQTNNVWSSYFFNFISGGLIGAMLSTTFYPFNLVKARMQTQLGGDFLQPRHIFSMICKERGYRLTELFRGVHLNYTRSILSWGIINASYELYRSFLVAPSPPY